MTSKVSFTVRRPTPISRAESSGPDSDTGSTFKVPQLPSHLVGDTHSLGSPLARSQTASPYPQEDKSHRHDSSDEDSVNEDELVTGFDRFGVQRLNGERKVQTPLVIPALKNKDWREVARKRRSAHYVPPSAVAQTGADGSVGGLGTRDSINSGPVLSGLQMKKATTTIIKENEFVHETEDVKMEVVENETEDQKALRAILAEANGEAHYDGPLIDIIPTDAEANALQQDVAELPDAATLEDYNRVPVSQFGAAMLRGMGWKEGTAATRKPGKGIVEPYIPAARPALLGIGAKEQEVYDDGSKKKGSGKQRPDRRYIPIIKQERNGSGTASPAGSRDRRERSRSPRRSVPSSRLSSPDRYGSRSDRKVDSRRRYEDDEDGKLDYDRRRNDDRGRREGYRERNKNGRMENDRDKDRERRRDKEGDRERERSERDRRDDRHDPSSRKKTY